MRLMVWVLVTIVGVLVTACSAEDVGPPPTPPPPVEPPPSPPPPSPTEPVRMPDNNAPAPDPQPVYTEEPLVLPPEDAISPDIGDVRAQAPAPNELEGKLAYHTPNSMIVGTPYFIEAILGEGEVQEQVAQELSQEQFSEDEIEVSTVKVTRIMSAKLEGGSGFEIFPGEAIEQVIADDDFTRWQWTATPLRAGQQPLVLSVDAIIEMDNGEQRSRRLRTFQRIVNTKVKGELFSTDAVTNERSADRSVEDAVTDAATDAAESTLADANLPPVPGTLASDPAPLAPVDATTQLTSNRLALILANGEYDPTIGVLQKTYDDADVLGGALSEVGFDVITHRDLTLNETRRALGDFLALVDEKGDAATALVYFSGHGAAGGDGGPNYVLPVDAVPRSRHDLTFTSVRVEDIINGLGATEAGVKMVIIDACRNTLTRGSKGFVFEPTLPSGTFIAFSTSPGSLADDNGVYAEALASQIRHNVARIETVFNEVQDIVASRSGGIQVPFYRDGITGEFFFRDAAPPLLPE